MVRKTVKAEYYINITMEYKYLLINHWLNAHLMLPALLLKLWLPNTPLQYWLTEN